MISYRYCVQTRSLHHRRRQRDHYGTILSLVFTTDYLVLPRRHKVLDVALVSFAGRINVMDRPDHRLQQMQPRDEETTHRGLFPCSIDILGSPLPLVLAPIQLHRCATEQARVCGSRTKENNS